MIDFLSHDPIMVFHILERNGSRRTIISTLAKIKREKLKNIRSKVARLSIVVVIN